MLAVFCLLTAFEKDETIRRVKNDSKPKQTDDRSEELEMLSQPETLKILDISRSTMWRWRAKRKIAFYDLPRPRFSRKQLNEFLERYERKAE